MFEFLSRLFDKSAKDGLNQGQREAYIDVLVWVMYKDRSITLGEEGILRAEAGSLEWESTMPLDDYLNRAINRVRQVIADEHASRHLLDDISERLETQPMRMRALEACRKIAGSDGDIDTKEADFIATLKQAFHL